MQELLKATVDDAKGQPVGTLRAKFHVIPERRPQKAETTKKPLSEVTVTEGLGKRMSASKKAQMHVNRPATMSIARAGHASQ